MWAFAHQCLRLTTDEFWNLSPREFFKLAEVYRQNEKLWNYRAGLAPAMTANTNRSKSTDRVWQPLDFFGGEAEEPKILSAEEILEKMETIDRLMKE